MLFGIIRETGIFKKGLDYMRFLSKIFGKSVFEGTMLPISNNFKPVVGSVTKESPYVSRGLKSNNFKQLFSCLTLVFLACSVFTTSAWAYERNTFPGVGSQDKWLEACEVDKKILGAKSAQERILLLNKAISIYPYEADFWVNLGNTYTDKQKKIECYLKAAELNPDDCSGYQGAAYEYQQLGQYSKAVEYWQKAIAISPKDISFYTGLAMCYCKLNKFDDAVKWSLKGYSLSHDPSLLNNAAYSYKLAKKYRLALKYYEECNKVRPSNKETIKEINEIKSLILNRIN